MQSQQATVANSETKHGWPINWPQVICSVLVGAILGIGATLFTTTDRIAKLEGRLAEQAKSNTGEDIQKKATENSGSIQLGLEKQSDLNPEELVNIIKEQQKSYVKESRGESSSESFTIEDLAQFDKSKTLATIINQLKRDNRFIDIVLSVKQMKPSKRQELLLRCSQIARPTWKQLGKISPDGQTEAGQKAEKQIASAIVDLVKNLIRQSDEDIKKLYV